MPIPYQFCNDLLIHHQSKSIISISDQSIDPSSNQLSDANPRQICSPIHHHNANPPRHYQSINPMPILRKIANPGPIHQSNASPLPIHQSLKIMGESPSSMPALDQSLTKPPNHCSQHSTYPPVPEQSADIELFVKIGKKLL